MGWHSTVNVTRSAAVAHLVAEANTLSDTVLGDIFDVLLRDRGYNVRIVPDNEGADDDILEG